MYNRLHSMLYNTIGNITCYITPLATSSQVDLNKLITLIFHIWYSKQRLACSSCTNSGIDVGDLTQNMFYNSLCNTLCNMLCNMLCMLCNMLCNIAYSRFTSGAIKSRSTNGRVSSRIRIWSPVRCFPSCLFMYM